jgi:hypothetical protein
MLLSAGTIGSTSSAGTGEEESFSNGARARGIIREDGRVMGDVDEVGDGGGVDEGDDDGDSDEEVGGETESGAPEVPCSSSRSSVTTLVDAVASGSRLW